jgi:hypothetical protein
VPVDFPDVALEHAQLLRGDGAAHQHERVDREGRVAHKLGDAVMP